MSRAPFAHDSDSQFATAPTEHVHHTPDPFGPALPGRAPSSPFETAHSEPVFATPSIAPAQGSAWGDFEGEYDDGDEPTVARKKPSWMIAVGALALIGGVAVAGLQLADKERAKEQRAAQVEQARQRMVALDAKRQSDEAARQLPVAQALPAGSSVAAMLAASTNSNGASALSRPEAEKPRGRAAARQAAAIKRALSGPSAAGRRKLARSGARVAAANRARAPKDGAEGLQESSDDPIYGL